MPQANDYDDESSGARVVARGEGWDIADYRDKPSRRRHGIGWPSSLSNALSQGAVGCVVIIVVVVGGR